MKSGFDYVSKPFSDRVIQVIVSSTDSDTNNETLDDKIRRRRGGRGKPRLTRETRVKIILIKLPDEIQMSSKVAPHLGYYIGEIVRFFPSPNFRDISKLVEELCETGVLTYRKGRKDERPDKYYYRTEKAKSLLEAIEKMKDIRRHHPVLE